MRGDDCGRCGDCVSSRRSASDPGSRRGAAVGARDQVGHGRLHEIAPAATAIGWQTPAGQELSQDVLVELGAEVSHPARQREGRQALVVAQRGGDDVGRQVGQQVGSVGRGRPSTTRSAISDEPARPDPARDRLAAGLAGAEPGQEAGQVDDAGAVVGDDDRARADVGAGRAERLEVVRRVEQVRREQAAGRPADEDRLDASGPPAASPPSATISRSGVPSGTSAIAVAGGRPDLDEDGPGAVRRARSPRTPRRRGG